MVIIIIVTIICPRNDRESRKIGLVSRSIVYSSSVGGSVTLQSFFDSRLEIFLNSVSFLVVKINNNNSNNNNNDSNLSEE